MGYECCELCPRRCRVNRSRGQIGFCGADSNMRVGLAYRHMWEEPCLSGTCGAGTVFFCHCSLRCVFCQNSVISGQDVCKSGVITSVSELSDTFLSLQEQGAHNIDLVTPTHYAPSIADAIRLSRERGLTIPFVWNSSGYESVDMLRQLDDLIDIYLPDFKYYSSYISDRYSSAPDYFDAACEAIDEMVRQTGAPVLDNFGIMQSGTIIRHLMLPCSSSDTHRLLRYISRQWGQSVFVSLMRQFTPVNDLSRFPELLTRVTDEEYADACELMAELGLNGWTQEAEAVSESFIPEFDGRGVAVNMNK